VGHEAALGFLGDSALLIMLLFFVVGGLVVLRELRRDTPKRSEPPVDRDRPVPPFSRLS
jgi:hypothetical protein